MAFLVTERILGLQITFPICPPIQNKEVDCIISILEREL
jgi:hypothetical protein